MSSAAENVLNSPQRRWDHVRESSNTRGVNCKVCWTHWDFRLWTSTFTFTCTHLIIFVSSQEIISIHVLYLPHNFRLYGKQSRMWVPLSGLMHADKKGKIMQARLDDTVHVILSKTLNYLLSLIMETGWPVIHNVVMYRHTIYRLNLQVLFSVVPTMFWPKHLNIFYMYFLLILVTMCSNSSLRAQSAGNCLCPCSTDYLNLIWRPSDP